MLGDTIRAHWMQQGGELNPFIGDCDALFTVHLNDEEAFAALLASGKPVARNGQALRFALPRGLMEATLPVRSMTFSMTISSRRLTSAAMMLSHLRLSPNSWFADDGSRTMH